MSLTAPVYCRTQLEYLGPMGMVGVDVDIHDARAADATLSWDDNGFELVHLPSALDDWSDLEQIEQVHGPEVVAFAKAQTGCDHVIFYPPILRSKEQTRVHADLGPIRAAHSDYAESYLSMLRDPEHAYVRLMQPSLERAGITAQVLANARRIVTLQIWRNLGAPNMDQPLALCDSRSVPRDELEVVPVPTYAGVRTEFESLLVKRSRTRRQHRWYTFPGLHGDEVLLFRAFDSDRMQANEPFWTPHCAFVDPQVINPEPRQSLEMRAICLFGANDRGSAS